MSIQASFPAINPSLDLNFAAGNFDPRITFGRASAATYYDGKTVAKAEENLLLRSQEFDQSPWEKLLTGAALAPVVTANAGTAPDGTATADRVVFSLNGGVSSGDISQLVQTLTLSGQYVFSVWLKSTDGSSTYNMQLAGAGAVADVAVNGSWQRFTVTGTYAGAYSNQLRLRGAQGIVNSNTADVLVWGAQLEQRSQVTAYTPTTTQPITNYIPVLQTAPTGVPRFDHNPVTGESLGLLVEEQRTNLLLRSEEFSNSSWGKVGSSIFANVISAPDGSLTVDKLVENSASGITHGIDQSITTTAASYTFSAYVKPAERSRFRFASAIGLAPAASFDLLAVTATPLGSTTSATITPVGNGWFRCTATRTVSAGSDVAQIQLLNNSGLEAYTGDGYSGLYIWGAQLEAGSFPTSYIKTEASQATRAADSASMTGANFSSWYRQDEGTLCGEASTSAFDSSRVIAEINDNSVANRIFIARAFATNSSLGSVTANGAVQVGASIVSAFTAGNIGKTAIAYKVDNFAHTANGANPVLDVSGLVPTTVNRLNIGNVVGQAYWCGHIKRISYYPKRLSDAQLQALTA